MLPQQNHYYPRQGLDGEGWPSERSLGPSGKDVLASLDPGSVQVPLCTSLSQSVRAGTPAELQGLNDRRDHGVGSSGRKGSEVDSRQVPRRALRVWRMWPPCASLFFPRDKGQARIGQVRPFPRARGLWAVQEVARAPRTGGFDLLYEAWLFMEAQAPGPPPPGAGSRHWHSGY